MQHYKSQQVISKLLQNFYINSKELQNHQVAFVV